MTARDEPTPLHFSTALEAAFLAAFTEAERRHHASCTLEHLLHALLVAGPAGAILAACGADPAELERELSDYLDLLPELPPSHARPIHDPAINAVIEGAARHALACKQSEIGVADLLAALLRATDAYATALIGAQGVTRLDLLRQVSHGTVRAADYTLAPLPANARVAVILHNDAYTTMPFVVEILSSLFALPAERAAALMMEIHNGGRSRVAVLDAERARERANETMRRAAEADFPLRCTLETIDP